MVLSNDVEIRGSIKFQTELRIDGKVEGEINSEGVLTVGENANINGEIKAKAVTVYGKVQGNITAVERCELKSKSTLQGDLHAARLLIEDGAIFIGNSEVTSRMVPRRAPKLSRQAQRKKPFIRQLAQLEAAIRTIVVRRVVLPAYPLHSLVPRASDLASKSRS